MVDPTSPAGAGDPLHPLAQALIDAHATIAPNMAAASRDHVVGLLEQFEADIAPMVAPIAARLRGNPDTPEDLHPLLDALIDPPHFGVSIAIAFGLGAILSPVLGANIEPVVQTFANAAWSDNPTRPISPEIAVAAVLKGVLDENVAAVQVRKSGYDANTFHEMVQAAGNAIGIQEALLLFRRGQINAARLREVEQYSNLNPQFYDMVPMLRFAPLSVGEVVTAALKGHMSDADATQAVGYAGVDPVHFPVLKASAGRPLGLQEMLHLWNRTKMTEAQVDAGIRQSDINDTYLPFAKELRHYYPPPRSLVPMLKSGAITDAQFATWMSYYGAEPDVVAAFRKEANHAGNSGVKELSQAQTARVYSNRLIDRPTAVQRLTAIGYPQGDADLILDLADNARTERLLTATINKIGTLYVGHKIGKPHAATSLNAAKVPAPAQADLFELWDVEREANLHYPTTAGVVGALRRGILTPRETYNRLVQLGVADTDMAIIVGDGWPPTHPEDAQAAVAAVIHQAGSIPTGGAGAGLASKHLTASQITRLYSNGTITAAQAITRLEDLGYVQADAAALLSLVAAPGVPAP